MAYSNCSGYSLSSEYLLALTFKLFLDIHFSPTLCKQLRHQKSNQYNKKSLVPPQALAGSGSWGLEGLEPPNFESRGPGAEHPKNYEL